MNKYDQLITKIKTLKENSNPNLEITPQEWELLAETLITIQFLETVFIFAMRARNLQDHE